VPVNRQNRRTGASLPIGQAANINLEKQQSRAAAPSSAAGNSACNRAPCRLSCNRRRLPSGPRAVPIAGKTLGADDMRMTLLFATFLGCLPLAARPADDKPKAPIDPVERVGKASDYFYIREWRSYYWREDFSFLLQDAKTGKKWRILSREPTPHYDWRMGTTFTGLKVDWKSNPRVKVLGVTGVDRLPREFYTFKLDEPNIATAMVVWVETAADKWQEFYVNNWFHKWSEQADPVIQRVYVDKPAPYDLYGYISGQSAPFSKKSRELIEKYPQARTFHGLLRSTKDNARGYEIDLLALIGPDKQGNGVVLYGDAKAIPLLDRKK
jgi:hypothetical protein